MLDDVEPESGGEIRGGDIFDRATGKPRMLAEQCATCIYRPGDLMDLRPGRLLEITNAARQGGGFIVCHSTLPGMSGAQPAVCRGFADRFTTNFLRIMERLGGWHEVPAEQVKVHDAQPKQA